MVNITAVSGYLFLIVCLTVYKICFSGIANTIGRVLCGWVSDRPWADALLINNVALMIGGAATIASPFCTEYWMFAVYAATFGCSIGDLNLFFNY